MRELGKYWHFWIGFWLILIFAALLRFYKLGSIPHGMTWDEAAIGYNGFAIFTTRRDEWLHRLPISFMSFGDFKAPLAIYLNGFFTALFGMSLWAVRLPFALASVGAIAGLMLLVRKILLQTPSFEKIKLELKQRRANLLSLIAGLLMTLSPWHLHYSRAGFESGLALFFLIWSLVFWQGYVDPQNTRSKPKKWLSFLTWSQLFLSISFGVASIYTYHSAKIAVPLIIGFLFIKQVKQNLKKMLKHKWIWLGVMLWGGVLITPLLWDSFKGQGLARLETTIFDEVSGLSLGLLLVKQYFMHLSPEFLIHGATTTLRHGDGQFGVLLLPTFLLVVWGIGRQLWQILKKKKNNPLFSWGIVLLLVGLIPAAMGEEVPHSNRALLALPGFILLATFGIESLYTVIKNSALNKKIRGSHGEKNILTTSFVGCLILFQSLFFLRYWHHYLTTFAKESAPAFKDGYLEAFRTITPYENQVQKIIFTSDYGQPYIYALFVRKTNPIWYQGGSLIKYEFKDEINVGDLQRKNTIIVASREDEIKEGWADRIILGSDGQVRFKIYFPKEIKDE